MLNNPIGVLIYLLVRNDLSWRLLSEHEKRAILEANRSYNVNREDYADPEKYGAGRMPKGENWDCFKLKKNDHRGQLLHRILERNKPERALEIGPGAGFYTRLVCEYETVKHYCAVDIGRSFLDYLEPRLERLKGQKGLTYKLVCGDLNETVLSGNFDLIVLFSTVHHIPNRMDLFGSLAGMLGKDGIIFCFDPSHYIPRIIQLLVKSITNGYLKKDFYRNKQNLSTHHMCTMGEYRSIVRRLPEINIEEAIYVLPERFGWCRGLMKPKILFSSEIGMVLRKSEDGSPKRKVKCTAFPKLLYEQTPGKSKQV